MSPSVTAWARSSIDLSDLEFIDSSGLQVLLRKLLGGLLGREDRQLAVVCPYGPVRRVFELSGVLRAVRPLSIA